ncbi:MAG: hypothetical protein AAFU54_04935 [Chloroflexota bacterium]
MTTDREQVPPDHAGLLLSALLMMAGGWAGLYLLVTQTIPRVGQRWMFFMLLYIAVTGTMIPLVRFMNVRFTPVDREIPASGVVLRQSVWIGLFVVSCAWLQIPRALTWSAGFFLATIFVVIEFFLRMRERQLQDDQPA